MVRSHPSLVRAGLQRVRAGESSAGRDQRRRLRTHLSCTIQGLVVLVGHLLRRPVDITNASVGSPNVRALVYIAAYAPDEGDPTRPHGRWTSIERPACPPPRVPTPACPDGDGNAYINPEFFHEQFCADLPDALAAVMAASQRPGRHRAWAPPSGLRRRRCRAGTWSPASTTRSRQRRSARDGDLGRRTVEISSSTSPSSATRMETTDLLAAVQGSRRHRLAGTGPVRVHLEIPRCALIGIPRTTRGR